MTFYKPNQKGMRTGLVLKIIHVVLKGVCFIFLLFLVQAEEGILAKNIDFWLKNTHMQSCVLVKQSC